MSDDGKKAMVKLLEDWISEGEEIRLRVSLSEIREMRLDVLRGKLPKAERVIQLCESLAEAFALLEKCGEEASARIRKRDKEEEEAESKLEDRKLECEEELESCKKELATLKKKVGRCGIPVVVNGGGWAE